MHAVTQGVRRYQLMSTSLPFGVHVATPFFNTSSLLWMKHASLCSTREFRLGTYACLLWSLIAMPSNHGECGRQGLSVSNSPTFHMPDHSLPSSPAPLGKRLEKQVSSLG